MIKKKETFINPDYAMVDKHTGELAKLKQTRTVTLDEFIMIFFASSPDLLSLKGLHLKVLICCWKLSSYNPESEAEGNLIHNDPLFKCKCKDFGLSAPAASIDNAISYLNKEGFLIKRCKGVYLLNPKYFFKGRLSDKSKIDIRFKVEPVKQENYEEGCKF